MSILDKLKHLVGDASTWILAGMPVVDQETYTDRLHLCSMCPHLIKGSCEFCGCHMGSKAWLATAYCEDPAHPKWHAKS